MYSDLSSFSKRWGVMYLFIENIVTLDCPPMTMLRFLSQMISRLSCGFCKIRRKRWINEHKHGW